MIAVNGDEKVDLENTQLYQKASRSLLTQVKTILHSGCCSSELAVFIKVHLKFITAEKNVIFYTTKRPNISRNTGRNCNFSLPFKNLPLKFHVIQTPLQNLGRNSLFDLEYFMF